MFSPACRELQHLFQRRSGLLLVHFQKSRLKGNLYCTACQKKLYSTSLKVNKSFQSESFLPVRCIERIIGRHWMRLSSSSTGDPDTETSTQQTDSSKDETGASGGKNPKLIKVAKKKPLDYSYTGNIFILPVRAMNDYLLKPSDLENLPKYKRRNPYQSGPPITVYLRSDVELVALKVWGTVDKLNKAKRKFRESFPKDDGGKGDFFHLGRILDAQRRTAGLGEEDPLQFEKEELSDRQKFLKLHSGKVILTAIVINAFNSLIKFICWAYTGSHSMFSEFVHSVADTVNQVILGIGLYHSVKKPDPNHPYGYSNLRHISSLISGVGIFCFGTGLSWYHGIHGLLHPEALGPLTWAIFTLIGSFLSEGASLLVAVNQVRKSANRKGITFWQYVLRGYDPNVNVVLLEDLAAVVGVGIAASCMGITLYTGSTFADSMGSLLIGGLLGGVAAFIISTNTAALVGKSIPFDVNREISLNLESDRMIRSLHDVKATEMGGTIRFKAEVDFDGREITRAYLYKMDMELLLEEMKSLQKIEDAELFMLNHGEKIIDSVGEEVDRIEKQMKAKHPELRHVDLEAL